MKTKRNPTSVIAISCALSLCAVGTAFGSGGLTADGTPPGLIWEKATASHYGKGSFVGYCGKRFVSQKAMVVAHPSTGERGGLRCGQKIAFKAPRSAVVFKATVVDKGPFIKGRKWDLSFKLARKLGVAARGVAPVHAAVLPADSAVPAKKKRR